MSEIFYIFEKNYTNMGHLSYPYPMDRFKELEPLLKQWFNIDRNTPTISKCISLSITPNDILKNGIPEEYRKDNGDFDVGEYSFEHSDEIEMPISDDFTFDNIIEFLQDYNIEEDTILFDMLVFMFLYNETLNKGYYTDIDEAEQNILEYAMGVRPEMLKLYILLNETSYADTIRISSGNKKSIEIDTMVPWLREAINDYLEKYLGVGSTTDAKREFVMNYAPKNGAPTNWKITQYIWGVYNLLEGTGFIKSKTKGKVSRKQAKFIEGYLMAINLIDIYSNIDANNIRSRLHYLFNTYDSIEQVTEELRYKFSPNNKSFKFF